MQHARFRIVVAVLAILGCATVLAGPPVLREIEALGTETGPGLPVPVPPEPAPPVVQVTTDEFELVGFTQEAFPGNRGILNMSRSCQLQFPGSRVCNTQEVMQSTTIPEIPRHLSDRLVWVQTGGQTFPAVAHEEEQKTERTAADSVPADPGSDCHGWTSASGRELGLAIELGPDNGCYGGFYAAKCSMELAAACCSRHRLVPVE